MSGDIKLKWIWWIWKAKVKVRRKKALWGPGKYIWKSKTSKRWAFKSEKIKSLIQTKTIIWFEKWTNIQHWFLKDIVNKFPAHIEIKERGMPQYYSTKETVILVQYCTISARVERQTTTCEQKFCRKVILQKLFQ